MANYDEPNGNKNTQHPLIDEMRKKASKADEGREPDFVEGRLGTRMVSRGALLERVVAEFIDEHSNNSPALLDADTESKRLKLVLSTVDYILGVETIHLAQGEKAELIRRAYAELFTYGPLDTLIADDSITTILLEGVDKVSVRYGHGELITLDPIFEDEAHLRKVMRRILLDAGTDFDSGESIIEVGLTVNDKRVGVNLALPPVTFQITADIRIHQSKLPTLDDLVTSGFMSGKAKQMLEAIFKSSHGCVIVGDTESGKTTLLSVLATLLDNRTVMSVERTGELSLADDVERFIVQWAIPDEKETITFGDQIKNALEEGSTVLLLDEVRADEPQAIAPLLSNDNVPRQIWTFRGPASSKRLISALGMLARRGDPTQSETLVHELYRRLPFVITLRRSKKGTFLYGIGEWQYREGSEYPDFVELMAQGWEGLELTDKRPKRDIGLDESCWL